MDVSKNSGTPQIIHFNRVFHYKPSILGYHYCWKPLYKWIFGLKKIPQHFFWHRKNPYRRLVPRSAGDEEARSWGNSAVVETGGVFFGSYHFFWPGRPLKGGHVFFCLRCCCEIAGSYNEIMIDEVYNCVGCIDNMNGLCSYNVWIYRDWSLKSSTFANYRGHAASFNASESSVTCLFEGGAPHRKGRNSWVFHRNVWVTWNMWPAPVVSDELKAANLSSSLQ